MIKVNASLKRKLSKLKNIRDQIAELKDLEDNLKDDLKDKLEMGEYDYSKDLLFVFEEHDRRNLDETKLSTFLKKHKTSLEKFKVVKHVPVMQFTIKRD